MSQYKTFAVKRNREIPELLFNALPTDVQLDWFRNSVTVDTSFQVSLQPNVGNWINDNITGLWVLIGNMIIFENADDLALFILRHDTVKATINYG